MIGLATGAVLALLAVDQVVLSPLLAARRQASLDVADARLELQQATGLVENGPRMNDRWAQMVAAGLTSDPFEAQSRTLHALREYAQGSGLSLTSLKPDRTDREKQFLRITLRATATGSMRSVSSFLQRVQASDLPLRVSDLQVSARKEGTDDLLVQLGVSTICVAPPQPSKDRPAARPTVSASPTGSEPIALNTAEVQR